MIIYSRLKGGVEIVKASSGSYLRINGKEFKVYKDETSAKLNGIWAEVIKFVAEESSKDFSVIVDKRDISKIQNLISVWKKTLLFKLV